MKTCLIILLASSFTPLYKIIWEIADSKEVTNLIPFSFSVDGLFLFHVWGQTCSGQRHGIFTVCQCYFTLSTKVHLVKATVFPVVMYRCESWTIKKTEHQRIDDFELWCWKRLLRVSWTARRSNPSILKEISPEYSLEGLMLKPKLQYFGYLMWRTDSLVKTLMLGKTEGRR